MKLNLGCGTDIKKGFVNVDYINDKGVNIVWDLNKFPYPFKDSSADFIEAKDIMEHLDNPNEFIKELYRIGKPGCKIWIRTPHFSSMYSWNDLTHVRPFGYFVFNNYDINKERTTNLIEKTNVKFIVKNHLHFGMVRAFGFHRLFNRFPFIYERYLCYIFPAADIKFNLEVIK